MKRVLKPDYYPVFAEKDLIVDAGTLYIEEVNEGIPGQIKAGETSSNNKTSYPVKDTIPDIILRSDHTGKILGVEMGDESIRVIHQQQHLVGQYLHQLFPPKIAHIHTTQLRKVLKTNRSVVYTYELNMHDKPGHYEVRIIKSHEQEAIFIIRDTTENNNEKLSLIRGIIEGEEKERKRVSQELHDGLGQIISALYMQVGTLSKRDGMEESLAGPMKMIADIISEYRAISHNLMPPILEGAGLPDVIQILCDRINATGTCRAIFHNVRFKRKPGKYIIREVYRISQELISNAIKHSGCDTLQVELNESASHIRIVIMDNGKGFDVSAVKKHTEGIGLKNIYTRMALIGGTLEFDSVKNKGTTVVLSIPRPVVKSSVQ